MKNTTKFVWMRTVKNGHLYQVYEQMGHYTINKEGEFFCSCDNYKEVKQKIENDK